MFYYLFSVEQEVKNPLPFNIKLFKYEPVTKKTYYVIKIDGENIQVLDDNEQILSSGILTKSKNQQKSKTNEPEIMNELEYYLSGKLTHAGGYLIINNNTCELIIMGSGLPYIGAYKGTLRKLIKKN